MNTALTSTFLVIIIFHFNFAFENLAGPLHLKDSVKKCLCESQLDPEIIYTNYDCKGIPKSANMTKFLQCYLWDTHDFITGKCAIDTVVLPTYLPKDVYDAAVQCEKDVKSTDMDGCFYELMDCFYKYVLEKCHDKGIFSFFMNIFG